MRTMRLFKPQAAEADPLRPEDLPLPEPGVGEVRLDVIDTNSRARALYERQGFVAGKTQHLGPLRYLFGFSSSAMMQYSVTAKDFCRNAAN